MRYRSPNRGERDLVISYFPIEGPAGIDRVASVLRDVTEQKKSDRALRLFRALIDQSNDAVEVVDPETLRFLDVNDKACKDLGYTRDELLGMTVFDIDPNGQPPSQAAFLEKLCAAGSVVFESIHRRKDGSTFPVEVSIKYVQLDKSYLVTVARDIADRKKSEAALREGEDRYRHLVEHTEDLVCTHDLNGKLLSVNPAPARLLGYEVDELLSTPMRDLIAPEFRAQFDQYLEKIRASGSDRGFLCVLAKDGRRRIWEYRNTLRTEGIASPVVRGMAHDVAERQLACDALWKSEERYRMLFEKTVAGVGIISMDGKVVDCNDAWARMFGHTSAADCRGGQIQNCYFDPAQRDVLLAELRQSGVFISREWEFRRKDGTPFWVLLNSVLVPQRDGEPLIQSTMFEITTRKRAEEALRKSAEHFQLLVEQASDGIFLADSEGRYIDVNSAGSNMLGYTREEILQRSVADIIIPEEIQRLVPEFARYEGGAVTTSEWRFRRKDGSCFTGEVCGRRLPDGRLQGILRDITERTKVQDALRHSAERFRVALKDSPITVFNQDAGLRYTWIYNPQLYWQYDVLGKTDDEIIGPKKAATLNDLKRTVLASGAGVREEVAIPQNGTSHVFDITIEPLFDAQQNVIGITAACMDIARLREMADRLQESRDRLANTKSYLESEIQTELGF